MIRSDFLHLVRELRGSDTATFIAISAALKDK